MEKENFYSLLKNKKSYPVQKKLYSFINNSVVSDKIINNEDIELAINEAVYGLSHDFTKLWGINVNCDFELLEEIYTGLESLISKSFHNKY